MSWHPQENSNKDKLKTLTDYTETTDTVFPSTSTMASYCFHYSKNRYFSSDCYSDYAYREHFNLKKWMNELSLWIELKIGQTEQ